MRATGQEGLNGAKCPFEIDPGASRVQQQLGKCLRGRPHKVAFRRIVEAVGLAAKFLVQSVQIEVSQCCDPFYARRDVDKPNRAIEWLGSRSLSRGDFEIPHQAVPQRAGEYHNGCKNRAKCFVFKALEATDR